ncbi:MAG: sialidase family protein [Pyrinomonadaceae bacterium]
MKVWMTAAAACLFLSACVEQDGDRNAPVKHGDHSIAADSAVRVSAEGTDSAEPAVAAAADGRFYVAWVQHGGEGGDAVYVRGFGVAADGALSPAGDAVRVSPSGSKAKSWRGDPPTVLVDGAGAIYVGWNAATSSPDGRMKGNDLMLSVSRDGGLTFDAPVKINDDTRPASHGMHALALGPGGRVFAAWLDERYLAAVRSQAAPVQPEDHADMQMSDEAAEPNAELYFAVSTDGGRSFAANRRIAADVCPCCRVSLAAADPSVFVSWRQVLPGEFRHIAVASSTDGGASFGAPVIVSDDKWKLTACPVSGPSLLLNDGALEIVWYAGGEAGPRGFYWSRSHDGGASFSAPSLVAASDAGGQAALMPGFAVWSSDGRVSSAALDDGRVTSTAVLAEGTDPQAALAGGSVVGAFTRSDDSGQSSVWLTSSRRSSEK